MKEATTVSVGQVGGQVNRPTLTLYHSRRREGVKTPLTTEQAAGPTLRQIVLSDLAVLDQALADVNRHTRECTACGSRDHDTHECVEWLRDRWAAVADQVATLRITTRALAKGDRLEMEGEE